MIMATQRLDLWQIFTKRLFGLRGGQTPVKPERSRWANRQDHSDARHVPFDKRRAMLD
jgi:hypothetical protein